MFPSQQQMLVLLSVSLTAVYSLAYNLTYTSSFTFKSVEVYELTGQIVLGGYTPDLSNYVRILHSNLSLANELTYGTAGDDRITSGFVDQDTGIAYYSGATSGQIPGQSQGAGNDICWSSVFVANCTLQRWIQNPGNGGDEGNTVAVYKNVLYLGCISESSNYGTKVGFFDGVLLAYDLNTLGVKYRIQFGTAGYDTLRSLAVADDIVYCGGFWSDTQAFVRAYTVDGSLLWHYTFANSITHKVQVYDHMAYFSVTLDGTLDGQSSNGRDIWLLRYWSNGTRDTAWTQKYGTPANDDLYDFYFDSATQQLALIAADTSNNIDRYWVYKFDGSVVFQKSILGSGTYVQDGYLNQKTGQLLIVGNIGSDSYLYIDYETFQKPKTLSLSTSTATSSATKSTSTTTSTVTKSTSTATSTVSTSTSTATSTSMTSTKTTTSTVSTSTATATSTITTSTPTATSTVSTSTFTSSVSALVTAIASTSLTQSQIQVQVSTTPQQMTFQTTDVTQGQLIITQDQQLVFTFQPGVQSTPESQTSAVKFNQQEQPLFTVSGFAINATVAYALGAVIVVVLICCLSLGCYVGRKRSQKAVYLKTAEMDMDSSTNYSNNTEGTYMNFATTQLVTVHELSVPGYLAKKFGLDYRTGQMLNKGGGGEIYMVQLLDQSHFGNVPRGTTLVVKVINNSHMNDKMVKAFYQELSLMHMFRDQPQFALLYGYSSEPCTIIMKFYSLGSLKDFVFNCKYFSFEYSKAVLVPLLLELARGYMFMHEKAVVHHDIKPDNVLLDVVNNKLVPAITDLGIAHFVGDRLVEAFQLSRIKGLSLVYSAPEKFKYFRSALTILPENEMKMDIYSFSILINEAMGRAYAFKQTER